MYEAYGEFHHNPFEFLNRLLFFIQFWRGGVGYEADKDTILSFIIIGNHQQSLETGVSLV